LVKHKIEAKRSISNFVITHKDLGNCRRLDHELAARQIVVLYKQVNQKDPQSGLARIRIKQG
ncbi:5227_t:CDS:1, partial [Gigaspora rosea]